MNVTVNSQEGITIAEFIGRMDATNATVFEETLDKCFANGQKKIIIDFSNLEYISSAGLRSILIIEKKRNSNAAQIVFCSLQSTVNDIFQISAFRTILQVVANIDEAKLALA